MNNKQIRIIYIFIFLFALFDFLFFCFLNSKESNNSIIKNIIISTLEGWIISCVICVFLSWFLLAKTWIILAKHIKPYNEYSENKLNKIWALSNSRLDEAGLIARNEIFIYIKYFLAFCFAGASVIFAADWLGIV